MISKIVLHANNVTDFVNPPEKSLILCSIFAYKEEYMIYFLDINLLMSFENQAISPKLDIPKRILEGVQMPENIPMPLRTRE